MAALDFMLDNLDDTSVITQMLKGKNWQSYFAPGVSINQQLVVRILIKFMLNWIQSTDDDSNCIDLKCRKLLVSS